MFFAYLMKYRLLCLLVTGYVCLLALNAFRVIHWLPPCPINGFLGVGCPGCGLNRAMIGLIHLDAGSAWEHNPLIFLYLPLAAILACGHYIKFRKENSNTKIFKHD
jgi:hypothetical protein